MPSDKKPSHQTKAIDKTKSAIINGTKEVKTKNHPAIFRHRISILFGGLTKSTLKCFFIERDRENMPNRSRAKLKIILNHPNLRSVLDFFDCSLSPYLAK